MENNNFVKSIRKSWFHKPVSQPTLLGNRCPPMQNNELSGKWCHDENFRPEDLKYSVPVNDNEPFSNVSSGMVAPRYEYLPNSGLGMPTEKLQYDFTSRENLSLCNLDNGIPEGNDGTAKHFNWNNPEKLIYTEDLAPRCNPPPMFSPTNVDTQVLTNLEKFTEETDSVPVELTTSVPQTTPATTTSATTMPATTQPVAAVKPEVETKVETEIVILPVETKKCKSAQLNMALVRDILILIGLICFVLLIIYIIRRYGQITNDLTSSSYSLSFENV
jgi:hypothetical protein